jgi:hypothetical protein
LRAAATPWSFVVRLKNRHQSVARTATQPLSGMTFNNSLLAWQARWKAQRETAPAGRSEHGRVADQNERSGEMASLQAETV